MADMDISKIVSLIMENPKLIDEIKGLAAKEEGASETAEEVVSDTVGETVKESEAEATLGRVLQNSPERTKRKALLKALKPYVSENRGKAIDSMMSVADILDMMKAR